MRKVDTVTKKTVQERWEVKLKGVKHLVAKKVRTKSQSVYTILKTTGKRGNLVERNILEEKTIRYKKFPLKEVTVEQLKAFRKTKIPGIVIKLQERYYLAKNIRKEINFSSIEGLGQHCCADCSRCYAIPYEQGGCNKVCNSNSRIEEYPEIKEGYELLNCGKNEPRYMGIGKCKNYEEEQTRPKKSPSEIQKAKSRLTDWFNDDGDFIDTRSLSDHFIERL